MEALLINLIKIIPPLITALIALIAGIIELRLNPKNWLNIWFALFFIFIFLGFLAYAIYHSIYSGVYIKDQDIIIPIMITAQIFLNFVPVSSVMTVFVLEKHEKGAMNFKYLGVMITLFIIMSIGYFIPPWFPTLDLDDYNLKIINTYTLPGLQIFVNLLRIILLTYVVYKYAVITKKVEKETKKRMQWFFVGIITIISGAIINLIGGILKFIPFEILALILFDIGIISIVKGFFM